jgi:hypothetical protein
LSVEPHEGHLVKEADFAPLPTSSKPIDPELGAAAATRNGRLHVGHCTFLPAALSGNCMDLPQAAFGHLMITGIFFAISETSEIWLYPPNRPPLF